MNNHEQEIESTLRQAPRPAPPSGLKNALISQVKLPTGQAGSHLALDSSTFGGWLRRWWPALVPAAVSVACALVITSQRQEIGQLQQAIQEMSAKASSSATAPDSAPRSMTSSTVPDFQTEIERLKQQAGQLKAEIAQLEKFRTENTQLRSQLANAGLPSELQEFGLAIQEANDKARRIQCVNNLKQIGLAVRIWAGDNNDMSPPNFLVMSNELGSTKILVCPADTNRPAAADWASFTAANCSYEYLAPADKDFEWEPNRVLTRCPIHGTVGLCDGSVQQISPERASEFVHRDGKLYMGTPIDKQQSLLNYCITNLRQFDGAKQQWALEHRQTAQAVPSAQDIAPYLKRWPDCPAGGQYQLNAVGVPPSCSIQGHGLPR